MTGAGRPVFPGLPGALALLAAGFATQIGAGVLLSLLRPHLPHFFPLNAVVAVGNLVSLGLVIAGGCVWVGFREKRTVGEALGLRVPDLKSLSWLFLPSVLITVAGGTAVLNEVSNWLLALLPLPPQLASLFDQISSLDDPLPTLFLLMIVAPITEEPLFRGLLLQGFASRYGRTAALFMSSALFALFHLNVWQALGAFAAGLYLGWLFLKTGSLVLPMIAHGLFNGLPLLLKLTNLNIPGYNSALTGKVQFQDPFFTLGGAVLVLLGLWGSGFFQKVKNTDA